jgi:hypothetical protein
MGHLQKRIYDMRLIVSLLIPAIAALLLLAGGLLAPQIPVCLHNNAFANNLLKYQLYAMVVALAATATTYVLYPAGRHLLSVGQLATIAGKETWLGINGRTTWTRNGVQLLLSISVATGIFMFLAVKYTHNSGNFSWSVMPLVLLLACTNALSEELIFRYSIAGSLWGTYPKTTVLIASAILFGLPHYYGNPSGLVGVIMSGVLGYILCKATIETKGIAVAWAIHFVQDVIIFTALMMMNK